MRNISIILLFLYCIPLQLKAQPYKEPVSPAYSKLLKAYEQSFVTHNLDDFKNALPLAEKAHPGHPYVIYFRAWLNHATGEDMVAALRGYSEAIRLMPELSDPYPMRASLFSEKGLYDKAIADMDKAIAIEGKSASADWYSDRAEYKLRAGNAKAAFDDFALAINKSPSTPRFYTGLVNTAFEQKNTEAAVAIFTSTLQGPLKNNGDILMAYGNLLMRMQKMNEADVVMQKSFADPNFKPDGKDYNSAGIVAYRLKDYPRATLLFDKAIALSPNDVGFLCNRASLAIDLKAWDDVYTYANRAITANPNNALANGMMAVGVKFTGRGEALSNEYYEKAKKLEALQNQ